jgi:hypothetical protein
MSELDLTRNQILSHWETEEQHILFQPLQPPATSTGPPINAQPQGPTSPKQQRNRQ